MNCNFFFKLFWGLSISILLSFSCVTPVSALSPPDSSVVNLFVPEYEWGYCGGCINETCWDTITITFFTLAVVNFDNEVHTLEQVILTFKGDNETDMTPFTVQIILNDTKDLPVVLYPHYYWQGNFTRLPRCIATISLRLTLDAVELDYGLIYHHFGWVISRNETLWSDITYYTNPPPSTTNLIPGFLWVTIPAIIFFSRRKRA